MRFVATSAMTARATAPRRSDQGARLKKTHHTTIANAQTKPPIAPKRNALGATTGRTYLTTHNSTAAVTPGHSRSGSRGVRESVDDPLQGALTAAGSGSISRDGGWPIP